VPQARATCKVAIRGSFDVHWGDYLGDMWMYADVAEGRVRTTTLFGKPPDLAAFIGMLSVLADLGFSVIACEYHRAELMPATAGDSASAVSSDADTVKAG
jgi:hypothetical protein